MTNVCKVFFRLLSKDPEKAPVPVEDRILHVSDDIVVSLQLRELLRHMLYDSDREEAVLNELLNVCTCKEDIAHRRNILADMITRDEIYELFISLRNDLARIGEFNRLKMANDLSQAKAFKVFVVLEGFTHMYSSFLKNIENIKEEGLSQEVKDIFAGFRDKERCVMVDDLSASVKVLREEINGIIREFHLNRIYEQAENAENSMAAVDKNKTFLMSNLKRLSADLGLELEDIPEASYSKNTTLSSNVFDALSRIYAPSFKNITGFQNKYSDFFDFNWISLIAEFDTMIGFASFFRKLKTLGLPVCAAQISEGDFDSEVHGLYSPWLVMKNVGIDDIVSNDYYTSEKTTFSIITGPNGGGKTIFLSSVALGQLFFQASGHLPATSGSMCVLNGVYTHFPVEEISNNLGRLVEERARMDKIIEVCPERSMVLLNETFSATKQETAYTLSVDMLEKLLPKHTVGLFVTHLHLIKDYAVRYNEAHEDSSIGLLQAIVDMSSGHGKRLFKVVPINEGANSYSRDILFRHDMTREQMLKRIKERVEKNA